MKQMNMKGVLSSVTVAGLAVCCPLDGTSATLPAFDGEVTFTQDSSRLVEIGYTLVNTAAVVTVDILTNGVSIGEANFCNSMYGEVNRLVQPGARKIYWRPDRDWPGHRFDDGEVTARLRAWPVDDPPPYMVLALGGQSVPEYRASADAVPGGVTNDAYKTSKILFRRIYATGRNWRLGALDTSLQDASNNVPYTASFTEDYYMQVFEMTAGQLISLGFDDCYAQHRSRTDLEADPDVCPAFGIAYETIRGATASYDWPNDGHQVDMSASVCGRLRTRTAVDVDLPTEAQWEVACRAGTLSATYLGDVVDDERLRDYRNSAPYLLPVGSGTPNAWGLYGMLSFRHHAVLDWHAERSEDDGAVKVDPCGPAVGKQRVYKGGCGSRVWGDVHSAARVSGPYGAFEGWAKGYYVFRLAAPAVAR